MKRILTNKEYRFIKGLKELMIKYNAVISTDALFEVFILFYLSGCNIPFIHIITSIRFFRIFASNGTF